MSLTEEKSPGILLQSISYLGRKRILKIFTPEHGLLSLIAKSPNPAWTAPFCIAEWVYRKTQKELHSLTDASLIDSLLELKQNYEILSAAGAMAQDLLRTQLPEKSASDLYELFRIYLKKLPDNPRILAASFRIKLLLQEGLLSLHPSCTQCDSPAYHLHEGESYCLSHAPFPGITFTLEEWDQLQEMAFARRLSLLPLQAPIEKIDQLFQERLS